MCTFFDTCSVLIVSLAYNFRLVTFQLQAWSRDKDSCTRDPKPNAESPELPVLPTRFGPGHFLDGVLWTFKKQLGLSPRKPLPLLPNTWPKRTAASTFRLHIL